MVLVIAEKPQLGRAIADALPGTASESSGVITKGEYTILWAYGHLLELKMPEDYDPGLARWRRETLPIFFENWEVKPKAGDGKGKGTSAEARLKQISAFLRKAEYVIHAGDPDEEGQLLIDEILRWCRCEKPVYRLETGDTTIPALQNAMRNLRDNRDYENLGWSAYARTVADLTVGVNLSRYFTLLNQPARLTVGRVQTPTLWLVVTRDLAVESHKKTDYYEVLVELGIRGETVKCRYEPAKDDPNLTDGRILNESYARSRVAMLENEMFRDIRITAKDVTEQPPLPPDLTELQTACGRKYGYTPAQIMDITQSLRENYRAITYNRSECRYLSDNHFLEAPETMDTVIRNIRHKPKGLDMTIRSRAFDSEKVDVHFAIIPQNVQLDLTKMTKEERNVYMTVVQYYMAQFMPPAEKRRTRLEVALSDGGKLASSSTTVLSKGYLALFANDKKEKEDGEEEEESVLSRFEPGLYEGTVLSAGTEKKQTKPPARYTQTSLNKDMTRISKYVDDPAIKQQLLAKDKGKTGENGSIGTVATRATIISGLIGHGFLREDGKYIISTPLGRELIRVLPEELKKPNLTACWWALQQEIAGGQSSPEALTHHVLDMVRSILRTDYPKVDQSLVPATGKKSGEHKQVGTCPRCGKPVVEGKYGYGCLGYKDGCRFTIWKKSKLHVFEGITFTAANARDLLAGKKVKKSGLKKKDGTTFEAYLSLRKDSDIRYGAEFDLTFPKGKYSSGGPGGPSAK